MMQDRMLAVGFFHGLDRTRYGHMIRSYKNSHTAGRKEWPKTFIEAYLQATNWKSDSSALVCPDTDGMSFGTDGDNGGDSERCDPK